jgi:ankyrin repeat protein
MRYIRLFEQIRPSEFEIIMMTPYEAFKRVKDEIENEKPDLELIKDIFDYSVIDVNYKDENNPTLLHLAILVGKPDIVKLLIEHPNINPNVYDGVWGTPLNSTTHTHYRRAERICPILLEHPLTDPNAQNNYGKTPLIIFANQNLKYLVELFLNNPKIDPNCQDGEGDTPLMKVVPYDHRDDIVRLLLNHPKIDVKIKNDKGETAWDMASNKIRQQFPQLNPDAL